MKKLSLLMTLLCLLVLSTNAKQPAMISIIGDGGTNDEATPKFDGGTKALYTFISKNIQYPATARENKTQGEVTVRFMIDERGNVKNALVPKGKGIGDGCDEEAIRVINLSPKWTPAMKDGSPVAVWYEIPIVFALSELK